MKKKDVLLFVLILLAFISATAYADDTAYGLVTYIWTDVSNTVFTICLNSDASKVFVVDTGKDMLNRIALAVAMSAQANGFTLYIQFDDTPFTFPGDPNYYYTVLSLRHG